MNQKDILLLLIPFSLLVVLYIALSVYHNLVTSTISEAVNIQITPISPNFDQKAIIGIRKRQTIVPIFETLPQSSPAATSSAKTQ